MKTIEGRKDGYHHGDLRNALVGAAIELATAGGPEAVVLREAARRVGVSPTAAYRHFAGQSDLLWAVKAHGQEGLTTSMRGAIAESGWAHGSARSVADPGEAAVERIKAAGRGYLRYAFAEPGLFRAAFRRLATPADSDAGTTTDAGTGTNPDAGTGDWHPADEDNSVFSSYDMLSAALDDLVATGRMPAQRRPGAEISAWSTVHGLAMLVLDGPLCVIEDQALAVSIERLLDALVAGLCA